VLCTCLPRIAYLTCELVSPESVYQKCDWLTNAFVLIAIEPYEQPFTSPVNVPFSPRRTALCCTCRLGRALDRCDASREPESIVLDGYMNGSPMPRKVGRSLIYDPSLLRLSRYGLAVFRSQIEVKHYRSNISTSSVSRCYRKLPS
jgi:hypothetical protein